MPCLSIDITSRKFYFLRLFFVVDKAFELVFVSLYQV